MQPDEPRRPVMELRVALTTDDFDRLARFNAVGLGLEPSQMWSGHEGKAVILDMGRATLEVFDEPHAGYIDGLEAGRRVSGAVRLALRVPDLQAATDRLLAHGATLVHTPVPTPWGDQKLRLQDPDGMQVTLFQVNEQVSSD